jgi:dipeptidase E
MNPTLHPNSRLLLISTSTVFGTGYLDHAESEIRDHLRDIRTVLFIPYALQDHQAYATKACARYEQMGFHCESIHASASPRAAIENAEAIFVGGGNTFRLLKALYDLELIDAIRQRVHNGMPYIGASAGTNIAGPTIRTTNDMPIVESPSLDALNLFPYQINPHYQDPDPSSKHMGETREERLLQYLEENTIPVIGLREGSMLRVQQGTIELRGKPSARIFERGKPPREISSPAKISL